MKRASRSPRYIEGRCEKGSGFFPRPHSIVKAGIPIFSQHQSQSPPYAAAPVGVDSAYPVKRERRAAIGSLFLGRAFGVP